MKKLKILSLVLMIMIGVTCFTACKFEPELTYTYVVQSDSMAPALVTGDQVKVKAKDNYIAGDIIAYEKDGGTYISRIIYVLTEEEQTYYICRGDNNTNLDGTAADGEWADDASYIEDLVDDGATKQDIIDDCGYLMVIITKDAIKGASVSIIKK